MELTFLGGANEVGRLGVLADVEGARVLLDYGMAPTDPPKYPRPAPPADVAVLTHAHLDHCGMMPWVAGRHGTPVVATAPSVGLAPLLCRDSLKVARLEGYPQPYNQGDIRAMEACFREWDYGAELPVRGAHLELHPAGHMPGSAMALIRGGAESLLFTGDLNLTDSRLVRGAEPVACSTLVLESTYAGREHAPRDGEERRFLDAVEDTVARGHTAVVPAFATGRTQEAVLVLAEAGYAPYVDGMGRTVAGILRDHPGHLRDPRAYRRAMGAARFVRNRHDRKRALQGGEVIVTTSGMLEGGPVLHYLDKLHNDPHSSVLLTGYQVEGTGGRMLLDDGVLPIDGRVARVHCKVDRFDFSGHAGHADLVRFVEGCDPDRVVLVHGDNREELAEALPGYEVLMPSLGERVTTA